MADQTLTAADGHTFSAYRAGPDGSPKGAVVVIQEVFGVNAHIRDVVDRFAAAGYLALAPAIFDRIERGVELDYNAEGIEKGRALAWQQLTIPDALSDITAAAEALSTEVGVADHVAAVGFCFGGMLSAAMATRAPDHLGAAVAYYPSRAAELLTDDDQIHVPLLIHLGGADANVTPEQGDVLAARWPSAEVISHPGADHGFHCDPRASYHAEAAAAAWTRTIDFLDEHLVPAR